MKDRVQRISGAGKRALVRQVTGFVLALGLTALIVTVLSRSNEHGVPLPTSSAPRNAAEPTPLASPQVDSGPTEKLSRRAAPSSPAACLEGDALARAWLTSFLTRRDRNDVGWTSLTGPFSSSRLVDELRRAGPEAVGLKSLTSWRVVRVEPVVAADPSIDTPTRRVLAYAATVTDGTKAEQKPFVLYSYLDPDGCWRVEDVAQPYSSEG